jgi:hypothetical protein
LPGGGGTWPFGVGDGRPPSILITSCDVNYVEFSQ